MKTIHYMVIPLLLLSGTMYAQTALKVEKVTITVNNLDVSVPFFTELLDFKKIDETQYSGKELNLLLGIQNPRLLVKEVTLQLGEEVIALQEFENAGDIHQIPLDSKSNDLWFQHIAIVVSDMGKAYERLRDHGVTHVSTSPQKLPDYIPAAAGIEAFYFQDPDKHVLEIISYPKGKGQAKWQDKDRLFLGIDHTAIGIDETRHAMPFYETVIGLKTAGHSENYGTEQEHLNQVFGARLFISGLKAQNGFAIEFLDYIAPPGGRPYPAESKPTDIWHWHTTIKVSDIVTTHKKLEQANADFISKGIAAINNKKQFMVRDVDGHALLITQ